LLLSSDPRFSPFSRSQLKLLSINALVARMAVPVALSGLAASSTARQNVLAAVSSLLMENTPAPVTAKKGGTSKGNPNAGSVGDGKIDRNFPPLSTADKAGAGIITFLVLSIACGMFSWMSLGK